MARSKKEEVTEAPKPMVEERRWYALRVISSHEKKIKERIEMEMERSGWKDFIFQVVVPTEKVYKVRAGKKVSQERNLLPGYVLIEALNTRLQGDIVKTISEIPNVVYFLGKENPTPMTQSEVNRLLGIADESLASGESIAEPFIVGENVKIIDGPFVDFVGEIKEVNEEKRQLKVIVKIFGRGTEVTLGFLQVEKIT